MEVAIYITKSGNELIFYNKITPAAYLDNKVYRSISGYQISISHWNYINLLLHLENQFSWNTDESVGACTRSSHYIFIKNLKRKRLFEFLMTEFSLRIGNQPFWSVFIFKYPFDCSLYENYRRVYDYLVN